LFVLVTTESTVDGPAEGLVGAGAGTDGVSEADGVEVGWGGGWLEVDEDGAGGGADGDCD
jgi:hypothetical protein